MSNSNPLNLPRHSKGKRPAFFENEGSDHLLAMVLELSTELAVVYDRLDRLEQFLAKQSVLDTNQLELFQLVQDAMKKQDAWKQLFLERLFSSVRQQTGSDSAKDD